MRDQSKQVHFQSTMQMGRPTKVSQVAMGMSTLLIDITKAQISR